MGTPLCILLVDESKFFLQLQRQFLRNTPADILTATSGDEALSLAREHRPSLVFMAMNMLEMSGLDCFHAFRSERELQEIPIILIGDSASQSDEHAAHAAGADDYLSKPLDRRHFLGSGHRFLMSIDRREPRQSCELLVDYICQGRRLQGRCIDVSSGGMFLKCQPTARKGETLHLKFSLPDDDETPVEMSGRIAWANTPEVVIKDNYPLGYGVEFVDIPNSVGTALRRCFGS